MHVAAMRIEMRLPDLHSLKEKRGVLKPIIEGARRRHGAAVAEVDHQDQWQRATIGVAVVSSSPGHAEAMLDEIERFVWSFPEVEVLQTSRDWMETNELE